MREPRRPEVSESFVAPSTNVAAAAAVPTLSPVFAASDNASLAFAKTPFPVVLRPDLLRLEVVRLVVPALLPVFFFAADGLEAEVFFAGDFFLGGEAFFVVPFFAVVDRLVAGFLFVVGIVFNSFQKDEALAKMRIKYQRLFSPG